MGSLNGVRATLIFVIESDLNAKQINVDLTPFKNYLLAGAGAAAGAAGASAGAGTCTASAPCFSPVMSILSPPCEMTYKARPAKIANPIAIFHIVFSKNKLHQLA